MGDRSRSWFFTWNNPHFDLYGTDLNLPKYKFLVYQVECGKRRGTYHLQGIVQFLSMKSFEQVDDMFLKHAHIERAHDVAASIAYCQKESTRATLVKDCGPHVFGELPVGKGSRTDINDLKDILDRGGSVRDIAEADFGVFLRYSRSLMLYCRLTQKPRECQTFLQVLYGPPGAGKTYLAHCIQLNGGYGFDDIFILSEPNTRGGSTWWDGYVGQRLVILDEFSGEHCKYSFLQTLIDGVQLTGQVKGGTVEIRPEIVIIISNHPPCMWYTRDFVKGTGSALNRRCNEPVGNVRYLSSQEYPTEEKYLAKLTADCLTQNLMMAGEIHVDRTDAFKREREKEWEVAPIVNYRLRQARMMGARVADLTVSEVLQLSDEDSNDYPEGVSATCPPVVYRPYVSTSPPPCIGVPDGLKRLMALAEAGELSEDETSGDEDSFLEIRNQLQMDHGYPPSTQPSKRRRPAPGMRSINLFPGGDGSGSYEEDAVESSEEDSAADHSDWSNAEKGRKHI